MNILFLTLLYPRERTDEILRLSKDGMQIQINTFQWSVADGLRECMEKGETLDILNALPVGVFPTRYRRLWLDNKPLTDHYGEIGSLNFYGWKHMARARKAYVVMRRWFDASPDNRTIVVYTLYQPYMRAVERLMKSRPEARACVIVTDLPNELGIASWHRGFIKKTVERAMGRKRVALCRAFGSFILLTKHMAEALPIENKPYMVMEGILPIAAEASTAQQTEEQPAKPVVFYGGTLNRDVSIAELLSAFEEMPECELWLCGRSDDMLAHIQEACATHHNIHYFGFVPQSEALAMQKRATALINPRNADQIFTRYSFPSKTLEYIRSGKPVLCRRLEGIPDEYAPYLIWMDEPGAEGIKTAVRSLLNKAKEEREQFGERARRFALEHKTAQAQGKRLLSFLREQHHSQR